MISDLEKISLRESGYDVKYKTLAGKFSGYEASGLLPDNYVHGLAWYSTEAEAWKAILQDEQDRANKAHYMDGTTNR